MADKPELESLYREAQTAIKAREYDRASELFRQILLIDEDYKDVSRLLARTVSLRRRRWYSHPLLWGGLGLAALVALGAWLAPHVGNFYASQIPTQTVQPTTTFIPTITPSPTPTPIPLAWKRIAMVQELSRDKITAIVVDPRDSDVLYVGTHKAGIYKSIDGGMSWQPALNGLSSSAVNTLVIDTENPNILYAGVLQGGVYKTVDGGTSWQAVNHGIDINGWEAISKVIIDPGDNQHLLYTDSFTQSGGVLYETQNGGESWQQIMTSQCPDRTMDFALHPTDNQILVSGSQPDTPCQGGVYLSEDGGRNWFTIGLQGKIIIRVAITEIESVESIYASTDQALFRTTDRGRNWVTLCEGDCPPSEGDPWKNITITSNNGLGAARFDLLMISSPGSQTTIYMNAGGLLYTSLDKGRTWEYFTDPADRLAFDADAKTIYRLQGNEAAYSIDGGSTWINISLPYQNTRAIGASLQTAGRIYIAYDDVTRIFYSSNRGSTWEEARLVCGNSGCIGWNPVFLPANNQSQILSMAEDTSIFLSRDDGATWVNCTWPGTWIADSLSPLAIDPNNPNKLVVATNGEGVSITTDGCQSWTPANTGLGSLFVNSIAIDPNNPNTIYAGTDGGAYVSFNGGTTWGEINDGLLGATVVYSIVVDSESNVYAATPYGIFKLEGK